MSEELGRYQIQEEIGQGGFAIVYRARDTELDRLVALKELRPTLLSDAEWVTRFRREAKTIARLDHPAIVTIHDVVEVDKRLFIVMRLVDGPSLDKVIASRGALPWPQVVENMQAMAGGLDYAHAQGILHRDLKPANILIDPERGPLLGDFGLAKLAGDASMNVTAAGGIVGTPHYIAPEVWESEGTTPQSDIYALGCILYEMLTGEKLFPGKSPLTVMMAHSSPLALPDSWPEGVPSAIADILGIALAKNPNDRYATAGELSAALTRLAQAEYSPTPSPLPPRPSAPRHNLPAQTTAFIGRDTELTVIQAELSRPQVRLLTMTGPGGTGKTRLSLQVATNLLSDFRDGVFFVALAPISDPALVDVTIAEALGVHLTGDKTAVERLQEYLQDRHVLLVLDNFEHVLDAAPVVTEILTAAPQVKALVTSRTLLRLYGEQDYPVPPLTIPDLTRLPPLERLTDYEAVQVFIERAKAVKANFALTADNAPLVAEICVKLDGLPLAIELAAARIRLLPPQKILAQLSNRLKFLTGGSRDLARRQQTLRNAIDWSYDLLEAEDQLLFQRLAVFAGGCTFEAAEAVGNIDGTVDVLNGLESLVDKNLLKQSEVRNEPRFSMLGTIREYGLERLTETGEAETIRQTHARYFMEMAEEAEPHMYAKEQLAWVKRLETEHDNLRTALQWSLDNDVEMALRIGGALGFFWHFHSHHAEGRDWLLRALAKAKDDGADLDRFRAKALNKVGYLTWFLRRGSTEARDLVQASVSLWRQLADEYGLAHALCDLGAAEPDRTKALTHLEESVGLFRKLGDRQGLSRSLFWQGITLYYAGDYDRATSIFEEGIGFGQEVGDVSNIAASKIGLGQIAIQQGDLAAAQLFLETSAQLFQEVEDKPGIALGISQGQADIHYLREEYDKAKALLEEGLVLWQELGGDSDVAEILCDLGYIALHQDKPHRAAEYLEKSLNIFQTLNIEPGLVWCLAGLVRVAEAKNQIERAGRLIGTIEAIVDRSGVPLGVFKFLNFAHKVAIYQAEYEHHKAAVRAALGDEAFEAAYAKGQAMSLEEAVAYALER